jgi:thymidylate synthase (FAD)
MRVALLRYTSEPEEAVVTAARMCYSSEDLAGLLHSVQKIDHRKFLEEILSVGHLSILEHAHFTFGVEGISRAASHQLVRHRLASYAQKSQRYVKENRLFDYIIPPSIAEQPSLRQAFERLMGEVFRLYSRYLSEGIPSEDARYVLPNASETKIIVTMNARELHHFFRLRCCYRAQWEIRQLAVRMLEEVKKVAPILFRKAGPPCLTQSCPEGKMSCGRQNEVRRQFRDGESEGDVS